MIVAGDRVHVRAGVMRDGWEGYVARTLTCGGAPVRSPSLADAVTRCAAGAPVSALRAIPAVLEGTGMGHEEVDADDRLEAGMVVTVEVLVDNILDGAVVHVTDDGPEVLGHADATCGPAEPARTAAGADLAVDEARATMPLRDGHRRVADRPR